MEFHIIFRQYSSIACTNLSNFQFCFAQLSTIQLPFILWSLGWPDTETAKTVERPSKLWFQLKHSQRQRDTDTGTRWREGKGLFRACSVLASGLSDSLRSEASQARTAPQPPLPPDRLDWARPRYSFEYEFKSNFDSKQKLAWRWSNWRRAQYVNLHNYANN